MFKNMSSPMRTLDRLSYVWLVIGAILSLFYEGRYVIPLAVWLAPIFLLRFARVRRPLFGFLVIWLVRSAVNTIVLQGYIPYPGIFYYALVLAGTLLTTLP